MAFFFFAFALSFFFTAWAGFSERGVFEPLNQWLDQHVQAGEWNLSVSRQQPLGSLKHVFSHRIWQVELIGVAFEGDITLVEGLAWVAPQAVGDLPLSTLQQKMMRQVVLESEAI